jgi:putative nucleotidyltransferase with HDIG domain
MSLNRLKSIVDRIQDLPTLPRTVFRITEVINNPQSSARDLSAVITDDQVLTARLLRLVNSSFYGFPVRIATVTAAIVLLGFDAIRHLLLTTSVFDLFAAPDRQQQAVCEALWDHSLGCAVAAKNIGSFVRHEKVEELFVCGLLHDIGKIVEMTHMKEAYARVTALTAERNLSMAEAEEAVLGYTHTQIGHFLAERWNLPETVAAVILHHHAPEAAGAYGQEAAIVHLADVLCRALDFGSGGDPRVPRLDQAAWAMLALDKDQLAPLMYAIEREYQDVRAFIHSEADRPMLGEDSGHVR